MSNCYSFSSILLGFCNGLKLVERYQVTSSSRCFDVEDNNVDDVKSSSLASKYAIFAAAFLTRTDDDDTSDVDANDNSFEQPDDETMDQESNDEDVAQEYLAGSDELNSMKAVFIDGDKEGSNWLVLDDIFILHKYGYKGENEVFWECQDRRRNGCNFKAATLLGDENQEVPELSFSYKLNTHSCGQSKVGPIMQKFRNRIKKRMGTEYKTKFRVIFDSEKKSLLREYKDNPDLLETILYQLKARKSFRVMANRARARVFPANPKSHEDIDLSRINLGHLLLGHCAHPDPEVKNKDVFLFGTPLTAEAFAKAEFKSGDGTFKICPKLFYQVFVLMALYGGVYVPCLFGLLPDKGEDSYLRFFGMLWAYNDQNGLPNNFENEFFMCDFELLIRSSILLYYPSLKILGCYFHYSQLIWRRVQKKGFQTIYEKNDQFQAVIRRMSALPFAPKDELDEAFKIFEKRTESLEDEELEKFCKDMIEYLNNTWRHGPYAIQDWNLSDLNLMIVPATNNGQEGSNRRFGEDFGVHPNFWSFILTMNDELERVEGDIKSILFGIRGPETNADYAELKEQREITKANYEANLITLDDYLGKVGALSMKAAKRKVASDDPEDNRKAKVDGRNSANDRRVHQASNQPRNPHKRRGRVPNLLKRTRIEDDGFQSVGLEPSIVPDSTPTETVSRPAPTSSSGLPWPATVGLQTRVALPSSKSRTTVSAASCPPVVASLPRTLNS